MLLTKMVGVLGNAPSGPEGKRFLYHIVFTIVVWTLSSSHKDVWCKVSTHRLFLILARYCHFTGFTELARFSFIYCYIMMQIITVSPVSLADYTPNKWGEFHPSPNERKVIYFFRKQQITHYIIFSFISTGGFLEITYLLNHEKVMTF